MNLKEALRSASVDEILDALTEVEAEGRQGLRFEVCHGLFHAEDEPTRTLDGPDPYALYDDPDRGRLCITGYDPAQRTQALQGLRNLLNISIMEANRKLREHGDQEYLHDEEIYGDRSKAEARLAEWAAYGFTGRITGFGEMRIAKSHTQHIRQFLTGPWVC